MYKNSSKEDVISLIKEETKKDDAKEKEEVVSDSVKRLMEKAGQGDAWSQYKLGFHYKNGKGVAKDLKKAIEWYTKSAEQGGIWGIWGQNSLGYCYENGQGVAKDLKKALEWYSKSADQGYVDAQHNLKRLLKEHSDLR